MIETEQSLGCEHGPENGVEIVRLSINSSTGYRLTVKLLESVKDYRNVGWVSEA